MVLCMNMSLNFILQQQSCEIDRAERQWQNQGHNPFGQSIYDTGTQIGGITFLAASKTNLFDFYRNSIFITLVQSLWLMNSQELLNCLPICETLGHTAS